MGTDHIQLLLADDDEDDCLFFKDALNELPVSATLTTVPDGEQLMELLTRTTAPLPDILFLDLNMPRKNGYECLLEIRNSDALKQLPVVILSTAFDRETANRLYKNGATHCLRKPSSHSELKALIQQALTLTVQKTRSPSTKDDFVPDVDPIVIP